MLPDFGNLLSICIHDLILFVKYTEEDTHIDSNHKFFDKIDNEFVKNNG